MKPLADSRHVVMAGNILTCQRCQATYAPALPCPIPVMVGMMRGFIELHENCKLLSDCYRAEKTQQKQ